MKNTNLLKAGIAKRNEFYTPYDAIDTEMENYLSQCPDMFKGKSVLCPCDDYRYSNFTKWFTTNARRIGLARLTSTCCSKRCSEGIPNEPSLFDSDDVPKEATHGRIQTLVCSV